MVATIKESIKLNLVVVAHPDDEILGFGATGAKLVAFGEIVQPIILCGNVDARTQRPSDEELYSDMLCANNEVGFCPPILGEFPNIRMNNVDHIDIVRFIEEQITRFQPNRIFTHHPTDLNDDHVQISKACMAAARLFQRRSDIKRLESLSFMEILSATDWSFSVNGNGFAPNTYEEVGDFLDTKIRALGCYRKVIRPFPHPRSEEILKGLAAYRGGQCGANYAEAFQTVFRMGF
jgi:LmbE family N-acetylglucosaminyl deacetylase